MARKLQVRRGTAANMPVLADGELGFQTDTGVLFIGNGGENVPVAMAAGLDAHTSSRDNPHGVTAQQVGARPNTWVPSAADVGLGNVDNTADGSKSVNYANTAGNANALNGFSFINLAEGGTPSFVPAWSGGTPGGMRMYSPANFSVNYANTAGNANALGGRVASDFYSTGSKPFVRGSYVGTGNSGPDRPTIINVGFTPSLIVINHTKIGSRLLVSSSFTEKICTDYGNNVWCDASWTDTGMSFWASDKSNAMYQLNEIGVRYEYIAFR